MPDGTVAYKGEWMENGQDTVFAPTVFLVEQAANTTVAPHFHRQNEFQVVVRGGGMLGRHAIAPITVHYAGAYTGYGPLVSGPDGLDYMTLRPAFDPGPLYVDRDRLELRKGPKVQLHAPPFPPSDGGGLAGLDGIKVLELISPRPDLCMALRVLLPAGAPWLAPAAAGSAGQFVLVVAGGIETAPRPLGQWETLFIGPDDSQFTVVAGASGAEVLLLQVPTMVEAYRSELALTQPAP